MRRTSYMIFVAVLALVAGCTVQRGTLDFPDPWFDAHFGSIAFIAFHSSTVLRVDGTYFTLALPFYVPLILVLAVVAVLSVVMRRRAHE